MGDSYREYYHKGNMEMKVVLDSVLVPRTTFQHNVRSLVPPKEWNRIRKEVYRRAGYKCEICGAVGKRHPVEAHEVWEYDWSNMVQRLVGLQSLCPSCHRVKHLGFAFSKGWKWPAISQLCKVNQWSKAEALSYVEAVFEDWNERSQYDWTVDISYLQQFWLAG